MPNAGPTALSSSSAALGSRFVMPATASGCHLEGPVAGHRERHAFTLGISAEEYRTAVTTLERMTR
ncbi:hypothetical protein KCMC57_up34400 [Kitasatospora sp. CMC57]|uniref:Uncharacterized protein n=1 Tax=Kitasatospora sp. CMC57 TaxID=3231513 RepID=A0AB33K0L3_9ACTN